MHSDIPNQPHCKFVTGKVVIFDGILLSMGFLLPVWCSVVCVYVYVCVYVCVCMCGYVCVYVCVAMYVYVCVYIYVCI